MPVKVTIKVKWRAAVEAKKDELQPAAAACPSPHGSFTAEDFRKMICTAALLSKKKLILVLDLDHTLLHSRPLRKIMKKNPNLLAIAHPLQKDIIPTTSLFRSDYLQKMTKLRPFVRTFLREAGEMFDMYVCTMGTREYALEMVGILDPNQEYFFDHDSIKVIAREDFATPGQKDLDLVSGEERAVVIVDDTKEVWERHPDNLVRVERYDFSGYGSKGNYLLSEEEDDVLARTLSLLKKIHARYFDATDRTEMCWRDTRKVMKRIREDEESATSDKKRAKIRLKFKGLCKVIDFSSQFLVT